MLPEFIHEWYELFLTLGAFGAIVAALVRIGNAIGRFMAANEEQHGNIIGGLDDLKVHRRTDSKRLGRVEQRVSHLEGKHDGD